jgi:hypothetical protein
MAAMVSSALIDGHCGRSSSGSTGKRVQSSVSCAMTSASVPSTACSPTVARKSFSRSSALPAFAMPFCA